jgi:putative redox protein
VVTIAAPSDPAHVTGLFREHVDAIRAQGEVEVSAGRASIPHQARIPRRHRRAELIKDVTGLHKALLVMHSPSRRHRGHRQCDQDLRRGQAFQELRLARPRRSSAHQAADALYAADMIAAWASRYIEAASAAKAIDLVEEPRKVVVQETRKSKFNQIITVGPHHLVADEPVAAGGEDAGPGPYDFLLAGSGPAPP